MASNGHEWKFFRAGGVDQVAFRDGADIVNLPELDPKLWVALAMPVEGVEFDKRTLGLIDTDHDKRIRTPEVLAAVKWIKTALKDPNDLIKGGDSVPLAAIKDAALLKGARRILDNLGKGDAKAITLADVADTAKIFAATKFNGDGVVPASAGEGATEKVIEDVIKTHGSLEDRSGKPGVDQARVDAFFEEATKLSEWHKSAEGDAAILPLGEEQTTKAFAAFSAVRVKVDDYFTRCRLAAFDVTRAPALNGTEAEFNALAARDLSPATPEVAKLPLARIEGGCPLPLEAGLNPAWSAQIAALRADALERLLGTTVAALTEAQWQTVVGKLGPYEAWQSSKPATKVDELGLARVREILAADAHKTLSELIKQDLALEDENKQIEAVEQLVRYQRDLFRLVRNFVSFSDFYARKGAIFQIGTLYLDGRSCRLVFDVSDAGKHTALANMSSAFLAYCECKRGDTKRDIVAAFTDGDSANLIVGRNGVFFDHEGKDWDATITRIMANPISIREAFWSPYQKFVRAIEQQVTRRATAAQTESEAHMERAGVAAATADQAAARPASPAGAAPAAALTSGGPAAPGGRRIDVGTVAAIGVAIGGIGAMIAGVMNSFFGLGIWMPVGIIALVLLISGPSMLLAWLKLRQRNLGPILDANGWAINGRARINVPFGAALTDVAALPPGSSRSLDDPYADKKSPWKIYLTLVIILSLAGMWYLGKLDTYLPYDAITSVHVLRGRAPACQRGSHPATWAPPRDCPHDPTTGATTSAATPATGAAH
jgi:hypothetical protein